MDRGQQEEEEDLGERSGRRRWILKPSTLNKGAGLTLGEGFEPLREAVHDSPDIREWVLQEYVERPLLAEGRKFHLRVYALAGLCGSVGRSLEACGWVVSIRSAASLRCLAC